VSSRNRHIVIAGAGLAGSLFGIYLAKRGHRVDLFERLPDLRKSGPFTGRSINLALSRRGIDALKLAGLENEIMDIAIPMHGRMMHSVTGELSFQPYGKDKSESIYAVSRGVLNSVLLSAVEKFTNATVAFHEQIQAVDLRKGNATFKNSVTKNSRNVNAETIIGADGANSIVRHEMSRLHRFNLSQQYIEYGYKEVAIPAGANGKFQLEKNALHIWPRGKFMLIALPNLDGSFTGTLFYPFEGSESFENIKTEHDVMAFFEKNFRDVISLVPDLAKTFLTNPTGTLVTIKCNPWHYSDKAVLLGDAAHAVVPFLGQGMNCAFESAIILDQCIEQFPDDCEKAFSDYETLRQTNSDALADMALENFIEMRDLVSDPRFLLKKKVDIELEKRFGPRYLPKYAMIQFHRFPYSEARRRGDLNDGILNSLCKEITSIVEVDWTKAEQLVHKYFPNKVPEATDGWN